MPAPSPSKESERHSDLAQRRQQQQAENRRVAQEALQDLAIAEALVKRGLRKLAQLRVPLGDHEDLMARRAIRKTVQQVEETRLQMKRANRVVSGNLTTHGILNDEVDDGQTQG